MAPLLIVVASSAPGILAMAQQGAELGLLIAGPGAPLRADGSLDVTTALAQGLAVATKGQIDSGSTITGCATSLLQAIGAPNTGAPPVSYSTPAGVQSSGLFQAWVCLPSGEILNKGIVGGLLAESLVPPVQCLVGDDILSQYDFNYQGAAGRWSITEQGAGGASVSWPWVAAGGALVVGGTGLLVARRERRQVQQLQQARRRAA
ncbi:MAG: hypothetical protein ACYCT1_08095 [Steroidobacteraceae bacterium]